MPVYLVRHGQSEGNANRIYQCQADICLTTLGVTQAETAAHWFNRAGVSFKAAYTSSLERAWHTADLIAAATTAPVPVRDPRLMEFAGGRLQGLRADEIAEQFPEYAERGLDVWGDLSIYGGESRSSLEQRVSAFIEDIDGRHVLAAENVLVVSHQGTLQQLVKLACTHPRAEVLMMNFGNCAIAKLDRKLIAGRRIFALSMLLPLEVAAGA